MSRNAAAPCIPVSYGNLHMLPSPTAEPTVVAKTPNRVANCVLDIIGGFWMLSYLLWISWLSIWLSNLPNCSWQVS